MWKQNTINQKTLWIGLFQLKDTRKYEIDSKRWVKNTILSSLSFFFFLNHERCSTGRYTYRAWTTVTFLSKSLVNDALHEKDNKHSWRRKKISAGFLLMSFLCNWGVFNHSLVPLISISASYHLFSPTGRATRLDPSPRPGEQDEVGGLCKSEWKTLRQVIPPKRGINMQVASESEGFLPRRGQGLVLYCLWRVSPPLIHVLLAILAVAPRVKSTLLCTYGGKNLVHQLNACCTTYTFCFISGPSRAANACKLGNLLCSKNTDRRS